MQIRLLYFAAYRELLSRGEEEVTLPEGSDVTDLLHLLWERGGAYGTLPAGLTVAVNRAFASPDHLLKEGDEVAFVPPVAGG